MLQLVLKTLISAALIAFVAEVSKRSTLAGAVLASLPLISVLALVWLYYDTRDALKVAQLASGVFWLVIPSLILFALLPVLLRRGMPFGYALPISMAATVAGYFVMLQVMARFAPGK